MKANQRANEAAAILTESGLLRDLTDVMEHELFEQFIAAAISNAPAKVLKSIGDRVIALRGLGAAVNALQQGLLFDASTGEVRGNG